MSWAQKYLIMAVEHDELDNVRLINICLAGTFITIAISYWVAGLYKKYDLKVRSERNVQPIVAEREALREEQLGSFGADMQKLEAAKQEVIESYKPN